MKKSEEKNIVRDLEHDLRVEFNRERRRIAKHFPLGFALAGVFGGSMLLAGVSGIIQSVAFLKENPILMLLGGLVILAATGTLYKKLG